MNTSGVAIANDGASIGVGPSVDVVDHTVHRSWLHTNSTVSVWNRTIGCVASVDTAGSALDAMTEVCHTDTRARSGE